MKFKSRYILLGISLLIVVSGLLWRVVSLQVFEQGFLRTQGDIRTVRVVGTPAHRGMITDRNGEPLAISTPVNAVWANPKEFDFEHPKIGALAEALEVSTVDLREKILRNKGREFVYLQRHLTPALMETIKAFEIPGVHFKPEYKRYYPAGEVMAHVVGLTNVDEQGKEGLELAFDDFLKGSVGSKKVVKDRRGREVQILEGLKAMRSGQDLVLSLDQRLQYLAYRELKAAVAQHRATAGSVVVLDVQTGEVLAMVNQPSFNPNVRVKLTSDGRYRNRAVTDVFEPGSVMKTLSVTSALQHGTLTPTSRVDTSPGWMRVGNNIVKEDRNKNFGIIDIATILQRSSNVGVSKLTLALPANCLWDTYQRLGFGAPTGTGFPGESSGVLTQSAATRGAFVLTTMAFGYGLSVTPIQLAQAYAILGAGGVKRPVTFLKQMDIPSGEQVIDPIVALQVVNMLESVVERGSGARAKVVGYHTAGKSGTARKLSPTGGYRTDSHISLFAGLAPAGNPRFAIVVMVDDPKEGEYYGSQVAAPVFASIAAGALRLFNVPPDRVDNQNLRVAHSSEQMPLHE